jgi:DNA-binding protein HU-beta
MNRSELIEALKASTQLPTSQVRQVVEGLFGGRDTAGLIATVLQGGEKVQLPGFGTFEPRQRPERSGLNPHTGQRMRIPASVAAIFRAGSALKRQLRQSENSSQPSQGPLELLPRRGVEGRAGTGSDLEA